MDKETFSSYGWIVITVLVLGVMIAFAGPFGAKIRDEVVGLVNDFDSTADTAVSEMGTDYTWAD